MKAHKIIEENDDIEIFDTLQFAKRAESAGFTKDQAEFQAEEIGNLINNKLVTKSYLKSELKSLELRLIIKIGSMMAILFGLLKFFH